MIDEIIEMYRNGYNIEDIADELNVDETYVFTILDENDELLAMTEQGGSSTKCKRCVSRNVSTSRHARTLRCVKAKLLNVKLTQR